jgi:fructuronate reductase
LSAAPRLSERTLAALPPEVARPGYDRSDLAIGVVHIGPGAFHRAHQAPVFDALARAGDHRWGIGAIAVRSDRACLALGPQDGLYTLQVRGPGGVERRVIGAARRVIGPSQADTAGVVLLAQPSVRLVTVTVTEAGYAPPSAAARLLARGMAERRRRTGGGLSVISCDNIQANGARLSGLVLDAAQDLGPDLAPWIEASVTFPNAMVDRITPAATTADVADLAREVGVTDEATVCTEPFSQWVIEDRFAAERPDFAAVGVQLVADVAPFEAAKLRLLNGAHSAMAWLGLAAGLTFVHEVVALPAGRAFVEELWDEIAPTLAPAGQIDIPAYRAALIQRFANTALPHRLDQIAEGSAHKIAQRLLPPLAERSARGAASPALNRAVDAWTAWSRA